MCGVKTGLILFRLTGKNLRAIGDLIAIFYAEVMTQMFFGHGVLANLPTGKKLRRSPHDTPMPQIQIW